MSKDRPSGNRKTGTSGPQNNDRGGKSSPGERKRFVRTKDADGPKRSYDKRSDSRPTDNDRPKRSFDKRADSRPSDNDRPKRSFDKRSDSRPTDNDRPKRSFDKRSDSRPTDNDRPKRSFDKRADSRPTDNDRPKRSFDKRSDSRPTDNDRPKRSFDKKSDSRPADNDRPKRSFDKKSGDGDNSKSSFSKRENPRTADSDRNKRPYGTRAVTGTGDNDRTKRAPYGTRSDSGPGNKSRPSRPYGTRDEARPGDIVKPKKRIKGDSPDKFFAVEKKPRVERLERDTDERPDRRFADKNKPRRTFGSKPDRSRPDSDHPKRDYEKSERSAETPREASKHEETGFEKNDEMPLNKFVAHCGISGRREAAVLVKDGKVKVNGETILEPGYKVKSTDKVEYDGKVITSKKNLVYILLNKPKNYITTTDDPQERRTVMELIADAGADRVYPVGRLDRNTTGLLLLTNDGELAQKLSHPKYSIKKVYQVTLDKILTKPHFEQIMAGITLEDGEVKVDAIAYLEKKNEIGIEIHSGRNRIVRRIFEELGYVVDKLDRVMYAGLTKKNIPRAKWRFLNEKEIINLKHFKQ